MLGRWRSAAKILGIGDSIPEKEACGISTALQEATVRQLGLEQHVEELSKMLEDSDKRAEKGWERYNSIRKDVESIDRQFDGDRGERHSVICKNRLKRS